MKVYVSLDEESYNRKPKNIVRVKYSAAKGWQEIDLRNLADLVGNHGHAIIPGHLVGGIGAKNCTAMQVFALDFDHGSSFQEIKRKCDSLELPIAFAYHTYSSFEKEERFRVVFVHETLIEDEFVIKIVLAMLHKIFPEGDSACKNPDRLFLGGKELIYVDENARLALVQLLIPFYEAMSRGESRKRNIYNFCRKYKIFRFNDMAAMDLMEHLSLYGEIAGIMERAIIHTIGESTNPAFFILESKDLHQSLTYKAKKRRLSVEGECSCQLLNDFNDGRVLEHNACFALLTNLRHVVGGQKHFFEILELHYDRAIYEKWKKDIRYMTDYYPQRCSEEFCPYYKECNHAGTIVETLAMDRKIYREKETYFSLEEARKCLEENLEQAFLSSAFGMHLIRAQTAIGKTKAYIDLIIKYPEKKFIIALPTNRLKEEVAERMRRAGINEEDIFMTISTQGNPFFPNELQEDIAEAHSRGLHNKTKELVLEYYNKIKDDPDKRAVAEACGLLLKGFKALKGKRIVVTTHAYFLQMPPEVLTGYTVIIDEDILQLQIFNKIYKISEQCLEELGKKKIPIYSDIALEILKAETGEYKRITQNPYVPPLTEEQLSELECAGGYNINDLCLAGAFVKNPDRESGEMVIQYFCPQEMSRMKYIVLSATLNENIYKSYFQRQMEVYSYPEKKAAYKGRLIQYTYHSLGRRDLSDKKQVFCFVKNLLEPEKPEIITFKEGRSIQGVSEMNTKNLHFGNAIGVNSLEGRSIGIVGTPFKAEEAYKLIACYLGADVNRKEDKRPRPRRVTYKKCSFLLTTYQEPLLREIQMYALESEMEQCVGRARILRKECTVYVCSAFPCEQAEIHMEDYLKGMEGKKSAECD